MNLSLIANALKIEEDQAPIIQLWDLRFATSPLKTLENHQRGVLSISWCSHDADLLVSSGKDNRIVCWNPNSNCAGGEVLSEIARTNQWNFDVTWCPKNPALIASPSFDGHVSVYSLMGGETSYLVTIILIFSPRVFIFINHRKLRVQNLQLKNAFPGMIINSSYGSHLLAIFIK